MGKAFDNLGGRKFIMGIVVMLIGAAIEVNSANGLSTEMAALITMVYATFSASNAIVTNKQLSISTSSTATEAGASSASPEEPVNPAPQETAPATPATPPAGYADTRLIIEQFAPILNRVGAELEALKKSQELQAQNLNAVQKGLAAVMRSNV